MCLVSLTIWLLKPTLKHSLQCLMVQTLLNISYLAVIYIASL